MSSAIVLLVVAGLLFLVPYITKRRFGVLGLALAAGSILSHQWVGDLTPIVAEAGFQLVRPPLESVVAIIVTLLPAILLVVAVPSHSSMGIRIASSATFALFAITLLLQPLGTALVIDGLGQTMYASLEKNQTLIISACLVLAIIDILIGKSSLSFGRKK